MSNLLAISFWGIFTLGGPVGGGGIDWLLD